MTPTELAHAYYEIRHRIHNGRTPAKEELEKLALGAWDLSRRYELRYPDELVDNRRMSPDEPEFFMHLHVIRECVFELERRNLVSPTPPPGTPPTTDDGSGG